MKATFRAWYRITFFLWASRTAFANWWARSSELGLEPLMKTHRNNAS